MTQAVPAYNLPQIIKTRDRLVDRVFAQRFGIQLEGDDLDPIVEALRRALPTGITTGVLLESVRLLLGQEVRLDMAQTFCWRLAGNVARLRLGFPASPWVTQTEDEWVPVQVLQAVASTNYKGDRGAYYYMRALAGSPCTEVITKFLKWSEVSAIARGVGFTNAQHGMPIHDLDQLVSLRFLVKLERDRSVDSPWFREVTCPSGCLKHNRTLLRVRYRLDDCPMLWAHDCHKCVRGYASCTFATHPLDYIEQYCETCEKTTFFDPAISKDKCLACDRKSRMSQNRKKKTIETIS